MCRGNTALHWAARNGHSAVVEKLITAGAKVDAANNEGHDLRRVSKFSEGQGVVLAEEVMEEAWAEADF